MSGAGDETARREAVKLLERRALSRRELRDKLLKRGHDADTAQRVIGALASAGLVDDRALSESIVRVELSRLPAGAAMLEAKLARRGIEREIGESVVREALRGRLGADDAEAVASKRMRALPRTLPEEVIRRRLLGALSRRGFSHEDALAALDRVLDARDDGIHAGG
ncbi:MAG: regulatory protein RecX [Phycisphaerales bacterium]